MDTSDRVSTVALAVSLVALIVAFLQLLAQFFGTADGYRRCSETIIGPWHWLRWRHWLWTEFRYETNFVTPTICLDVASSSCHERLIKLAEVRGDLGDRPPSHRSLVSWSTEEDEARDANWVLRATIHPLNDPDHDGAQTANKEGCSPLQGSGTPAGRHHAAQKQLHRGTMFRSRGTRYASRTRNMASWLTFLRALSEVYESYPSRCQTTSDLVVNTLNSSNSDSEDGIPPRSISPESQKRSEVSVSFSHYSWDAMPADVPGPLAQTQLGTLIILAVRMGMEWQRLNISRGILLASGNGYSFSFIEVQSLGWVASLNDTASHSRPPAIAPGQAVEKLMFGIIPACRRLVGEDLRCISSDGGINVFETLCRELPIGDFAKRVREKMRERDHPVLDRAFDNDILTLLCEFLAVPNSIACGHYCWLWRWAPRAASFHHWAARYALRKYLLDPKKGQLSPTLSEVVHFLSHLESSYPSVFYALENLSPKRNPSANKQQEASDLLRDCQSIFNWTSQWFLEHGYDQREYGSDTSGDKGHTQYVHLVVAHWRMSYAAVDAAIANKKAPGKHNRLGIHNAYKLDDVPPNYKWFHARTFDLINACIRALDQNEVIDYMTNKGFSDEQGHFNEAWWVLMLRGHVWDMATQEVRPDQETNGRPIPSMLYKDATPIWIS